MKDVYKGTYSLLNEKGVTLIEVMVVAAIIGLLAGIVIPSYQSIVRQSREKQAIAHLTEYYLRAKILIAEFGYNPGNFMALGFKPDGRLYHRITAADGQDLPSQYPDPTPSVLTPDNECISTDPSNHGTPSHALTWTEAYSAYPLPTGAGSPYVGQKDFNVYAYPGDRRARHLCIDEGGDVIVGNCN